MDSKLALLLTAGIITSVAVATNTPPANVRVAPPAPAFKLTDLQGQPVRLADWPGRAVVVTFWASWDKPSQRQIATLVELQRQYGTGECVVVGITLDTEAPGTVASKAAELGIKFPVAQWDSKVVEQFGGITAIPVTFVIDRNHNIIQHYVGFTEARVLADDLKLILQR